MTRKKLMNLAMVGVLGAAGFAASLPTASAQAQNGGASVSAAGEQSGNGRFTVTRIDDSHATIALDGAVLREEDGDVVIKSASNDFTENLTREVEKVGSQVEIRDETTAVISAPQESRETSSRQARSLSPDAKCMLGTLGTEVLAGTTAIIGIASAPVTLGAGAAAGLAGAAAAGGAAAGAAQNC